MGISQNKVLITYKNSEKVMIIGLGKKFSISSSVFLRESVILACKLPYYKVLFLLMKTKEN